MNTPPNEAAPSNGVAIAPAPPPTDGRAISVFSSADNFVAGQRMARALSESSLVPEAYRGNLPNVLIALELASRIGASALMVMQSLDIVHGRPSWRASFLIATVNSSGKFTPLRFRWQGTEGTDSWGCRAVAKDKDGGEECVGPLITIALAKGEGWVQRKGSKWQTLPELMLCYRAAAFWCRLFAPELSLGMRTAEEAQDMPAVDTVGYEVRQVPPATSAADLEAKLRAEAPKGGPATSPATAAAPAPAKPASIPPPADTAQPGETCPFCSLPILDARVEIEGSDGELVAKHEDCNRFSNRSLKPR